MGHGLWTMDHGPWTMVKWIKEKFILQDNFQKTARIAESKSCLNLTIQGLVLCTCNALTLFVVCSLRHCNIYKETRIS